ncbi:MAG: ankyrin repeat domain-containing protein [Chlamydiales bacterium]|nr:ankyrin repeat domain-containing protein [Chlamydiales bacterium]
MAISSALIYADKVCNYIPFISTLSNAMNLFQKYGPSSCLPDTITKSRYWEYIQAKNTRMSVALLVPIFGNLIFLTYNYVYDDFIKKIEEFYDVTKKKNETIKQENCDLRMKIQQLTQERNHVLIEGIVLAPCFTGKSFYSQQSLQTPTTLQRELYFACYSNNPDKEVRELLSTSVDPNFYQSGTTPLIIACEHNQVTTARLLLEANANANAPNFLGLKPLTIACARGHLEIVKLLCNHQDINVPLDIPNLNSSLRKATPLEIATAAGHSHIVAFLKEQGAQGTTAQPPETFRTLLKLYPLLH